MDAVLFGVDVVATSGFGALEQFNVSVTFCKFFCIVSEDEHFFMGRMDGSDAWG